MGSIRKRKCESPGILDETTGEFDRRSTDGGISSEIDGSSEILEYEKLTSELVSRIKGTAFKPFRRYLSDVLACDSSREANRISRLVIKHARNYPGNLCLVSTHDDHVHVVHDCPYSGSTCRCKILQEEEIKFKRRGALRKRKTISSIQPDQWINIIKYFVSNGRWLEFVKVGGSVVRLSSRYKALQSRYYQTSESRPILGTCDFQGSGELSDEQSDIQDSAETQRTYSRNSRTRRRRSGNLSEEMEKILNEHPVCPLAAIVSTHEWLTNKNLKLLRADDSLVKSYLDAKAEELCYWSMHDFYNFYNQPYCKPTFMAGYQNVEDRYYNIEDSIVICNRLLKYQFDEDTIQIKAFLLDLYNIIERKYPKCNTLVIKSNPNGGKNFFIDMFLHFLMNYGQLGLMNKTNNFSLQEATSKRILLWNEPNYENSYTDTLKMLLGGDALSVRVKQKKDCHVYKTPLIVLTNENIPFLYEHAFVTRIKKYMWKEAPFLKEYNKKPNPLCAFEMFVYWEIIERNIIQ